MLHRIPAHTAQTTKYTTQYTTNPATKHAHHTPPHPHPTSQSHPPPTSSKDTAEGIKPFLEKFLARAQALEVGERLVFCGGWMQPNGGHAIMHVLEREAGTTIASASGPSRATGAAGAGEKKDGGAGEAEEDSFAFVTINTGEGVNYHPSIDTDYPKSKYKTAIRMAGIPRSRIMDPAVW